MHNWPDQYTLMGGEKTSIKMSKLSKLEPYRKVIFGLKDKGKSCRIIAEHLKKQGRY